MGFAEGDFEIDFFATYFCTGVNDSIGEICPDSWDANPIVGY